MRQADLDRAVARATGETVSTIKRLGFLLTEPYDGSEPYDGFEPYDPVCDEHGPYVIDWDEIEAERHKKITQRPRYELATA